MIKKIDIILISIIAQKYCISVRRDIGPLKQQKNAAKVEVDSNCNIQFSRPENNGI
jgi:hypothetical protein